MILILGSGYIGQAFTRELKRRNLLFEIDNRAVFKYTEFSSLSTYLANERPDLVINAAGFCGQPNVDECENRKSETLTANVILPALIAAACEQQFVSWIHVSSGCIFDGPSPDGAWTERDVPNFSFENKRHSFYSASKALGERAISRISNCRICRLRMPFDENDHPKNLLSKLQSYARVYDSPANSLSRRGDCVRACVDLWDKGAPAGIYNVTNPGAVTNRQIIGMIKDILKPNRKFEFWQSDATFYAVAAKAPRSNCVLSPAKLLAAGIEMRPVEQALTESLQNWKTAP